MPNITTELLQFLMNLFGDRQAAQEFLDNPEEALGNAGLGSVCSADVDAVMPIVVDYAPITVKSSFDREYNTGGNSSWAGTGAAAAPAHHAPAHHEADHAHAVQQLHHVVHNYSYTSTVDDRDTITDQSVNQNIWADGDVTQLFDNDAVVASGDGAIAAGNDVEIDESEDNSTNITIGDIEDSFNQDNDTRVDVDIEDSFNEDNDGIDGDENIVGDENVTGDDNIVGDENVVGDGNAGGDIVGGDQVGGDQVGGDQIEVGDVDVEIGDIVGGDQVGGDNVGGDLIDVGDVTVGDIVGGDLVEGPVVGGDLVDVGDVTVGDIVGGDLIEDVELGPIVGGDLIGGDVVDGGVIGDIDVDLDLPVEVLEDPAL